MSGTADLIVAGGMQNMSQIPISSAMIVGEQFGFTSPTNESKSWLHRYGDQEISQFRGSELIAEKWNISREEMEQYALTSHQRAQEAIRAGHFENEIIAVDGFVTDEGPRETSLEKMAGLKTLVEGGRLTAAMASQISDGASAVLLASERRSRTHGLTPRARIHHISARGADPVFMLTGPIPATRYALEKTGLSIDDIDTVEINEAFAPVVDGVAQGDQGRPGEGQPQRRRDRARPSARRDRREAVHHHAQRTRAHRRPLRPADDVRGRRHRQRHDHRAPLIPAPHLRRACVDFGSAPACRPQTSTLAEMSGMPEMSVVVDDHTADVAAGEHVVVGVVDVVEFVLGGDRFVEQ